MDDMNRIRQTSCISSTSRYESKGRLSHRLMQRGQAMIEVAVMGSLALAALSLLIHMGLRMNYQQQIEQETFRQALGTAKNGDPVQAVVVYQFRNRIMPDPSFGLPIRPRIQTQASAAVTWHPRLTKLEENDRASLPLIRVELDGGGADYRSEDLIDDGEPDKKKPLIANIHKTTTATGDLHQEYVEDPLDPTNGTRRTVADVTTTENTTLTLNVNRGPTTLSSSVSSRAQHDW